MVDKLIAHAHEVQTCHAGPETTLAILREIFWLLCRRNEIPDVPKEATAIAPVTSRFLYRQTLVNRFWKRWLTEYLPRLTVRQKWREEKPPLKVGDVVLISEDNVKRGKWPLGVVQEVHKGADNLIRSYRHLKNKVGRKKAVNLKAIFVGRSAESRKRKRTRTSGKNCSTRSRS